MTNTYLHLSATAASETGQTLAEYALVLSLVSVAGLAFVTQIGDSAASLIGQVLVGLS